MGEFQVSNICTAINTARNLGQFNISDNHIRKAITKIRSEGRLQIIDRGKLKKHLPKKNQILIIDGAHNPLAGDVVNKYLRCKKFLFFRILRDI